jgi:nicotinamide mononucleotide transporter
MTCGSMRRVTSLCTILAWLDSPAFSMLNVPVSWAELLGDVTGALCVWLLARQNLLTWPLGLLNNVFWGLLFFRSKLYADSVLQSLFFAFGVYGWWRWTRPRPVSGGQQIRRTSSGEWWAFGASAAVATMAAALLLRRFTDSPAPLADASILTLSLVATYGQAHRLLESWIVWIVVDVISVPLYISRGLYPTAGLYVIFGVLCVMGLAEWSRAARAPRQAAAVSLY